MKFLIIIDMLNGFCRKGYPLSLDRPTEGIENYIHDLLTKMQSKSEPYFFICDAHDERADEFKQYPTHCLAGTEEAGIISTLKGFSNEQNILYKNTLSIFYKTGLDEYLSRLKPTEFHITGVLTDICVFFAAYEARNRGFKTFVHQNGIMALNDKNELFFIEYMQNNLGVEIVG